MDDRDELIKDIKEKDDKISDLEKSKAELEDKIEELEDKITDLKNELEDKERELEDWEDHECECDCEDEIHQAVGENIPCETLDDQRKIDLLANNWHSITFDHIEAFLKTIITNPLPPRI
jgi:chromosome segregation ATPase